MRNLTPWMGLAALALLTPAQGVGAAAKRLMQACEPLLAGAAAAYVISIPMGAMERRLLRGYPRLRRVACLALAVGLCAGLAGLLAWLIGPALIRSAAQVTAAAPLLLQELQSRLPRLARLIPPELPARLLERALELAGAGVGYAGQLLAGASSAVTTAGLSMVFAAYLLLYREQLGRDACRALTLLLGSRRKDGLLRCAATLHQCLRQYLVGQCTEAALMGVLCYGGMAVCGFACPLAIAALTGLSALIPVAGPLMAAAGGAFLLLMSAPQQIPLFLLFLFVLMQVESTLLYPRIVGTSLGLHGAWVLAAVTLGGGLMGVPGMLLGAPLAAALRQMAGEALARREAASTG